MHRGTPHKGSVKHKGFSKQRQKITEKQHTSQASYTLSKKRKRVVQSKGSPHQPSKQHMKLSDEASLSKKSETQRKTLSLHKKRIKLNDDNPQRTKLEHQSNKSPVDAENKALSRQKLKKKLTEARKKHAKPHFELGKEVKELWETLRKKKLEKTEHARITATILQKMKGKAKEMVTSHVMSRVLQTCLKFCNAEERASIYEELRPQFLELAQNTYAHHLVLKMLDHAAADKKQLQKMIASLHGHVVAYLRHPVASAVVEHAYKLASSAQKQELLAEFFSPEYRLFKGIVSKTPCRLVDLLAQEPATKRRSVMEHMAGSLQPILEKGIVDHSIIHRALIEYLSIAGKAMATDILQQLSGPSLIRVIHTREGAKIGVTCVSIGTRKERKKIIKGMKGHATKVACDVYGSVVLVAILDLVDDTEMLNKFIVSELANNVEKVAFDRHGRRLFLHLLSPQKSHYISVDALTALQIRNDSFEEVIVKEKDVEDGELLEGSSVGSKKDSFVRRRELLQSSCLGEKLVDLCIVHVGDLLRSPVGKDLIYEVAKGGQDGVLWHVTPTGVCKLHQAIANVGAQPRSPGKEEHIFEQYHASRTIKRLISEPAVLPDDITPPSFASVLWNTALKGKCTEWATGHSQKIVSAFQLCAEKKLWKEAMKELQPLIDSGLLQTENVTTETAKGAKRKRAVKGK